MKRKPGCFSICRIEDPAISRLVKTGGEDIFRPLKILDPGFRRDEEERPLQIFYENIHIPQPILQTAKMLGAWRGTKPI